MTFDTTQILMLMEAGRALDYGQRVPLSFGDGPFMAERRGDWLYCHDRHGRPITSIDLKPSAGGVVQTGEAPFITLPPPGYQGGLYGWEMLAPFIQCQMGVVAVVPDPPIVTVGMILMPSQAAANSKPDVGTVLSSGYDGIAAGDRVLYGPYSGVWFDNFTLGPWMVDELRFYGIVSPSLEDMVVTEPIEECIPAKLVGDRIVPVGEMVLIKRDPMKTTHGSLELDLPDDAKFRTMRATVVAAGPKALGPDGKTPIQEGQRVVYHGPSLVIGLKGVGERMGGLPDLGDYALIKSRNLYCVLGGE